MSCVSEVEEQLGITFLCAEITLCCYAEQTREQTIRSFLVRGAMDAIAMDANNQLVIVDWKHCEDLQNYYKASKFYKVDCYQLMIYQRMLKELLQLDYMPKVAVVPYFDMLIWPKFVQNVPQSMSKVIDDHYKFSRIASPAAHRISIARANAMISQDEDLIIDRETRLSELFAEDTTLEQLESLIGAKLCFHQ